MENLTKTFTIQGKEFTLKKTSKANIDRYQAKMNELTEKAMALKERLDAGEEVNEEEVPDAFELSWIRLTMVCDGPFEEIDKDEVGLEEINYIHDFFIAPLKRIYDEAIGS